MLSQLIFISSACVWLLGDIMEKKIFVVWVGDGRGVGTNEYVYYVLKMCFLILACRPICTCACRLKTFHLCIYNYPSKVIIGFRNKRKVLLQNINHGLVRPPEIVSVVIILDFFFRLYCMLNACIVFLNNPSKDHMKSPMLNVWVLAEPFFYRTETGVLTPSLREKVQKPGDFYFRWA